MKTLFLILIFTISFVKSNGQAAVEDVVFDLQYYGGGYTVHCHGETVDIEPILIGAVPPFTCKWYNDTGAVISQSLNIYSVPAGLGRYILEITKGTWQQDYDVYLTEPDQLILSLEGSDYNGYNISEHGGHDGIINSQIQGGIPPYDYTWSNGSSAQNLDGLTVGTYTLTITDAGGCTQSQTKVLNEPTVLHASISSPAYHGYNVKRHEGHNGAVNLTVTGGTPPYTYYWSSGDTTKDVDTVLTAHLHTVIITDNNNASIIKSITLTEPAALDVTLSPSIYADFNLSCHDCHNGSIMANVTGGVQPYTFKWSNSQTTQTISNLSANVYSVSVMDAHGARMEKEILLRAPDRDDWSMSGNANTTSSQFIGTTDNKDLVFKTNNSELLRLKSNGIVNSQSLAGTGSEVVMADSTGNLFRVGPSNQSQILCFPWNSCGNNTNNDHFIGTLNNSDLIFKTNSEERMRIKNTGANTGAVVIGQVPSLPGSYKLYVSGGILTEKLRVADPSGSYWADFVFTKNYKLKPLSELKKYINNYKHLPDIPTSNEVKENGVDVMEMQAKLLQKIEENTLYIIEIHEKYEALKLKYETLQSKLNNK